MTKVDLSQQLEVYKKNGANLLMPSMMIEGLSEFHAPVVETVTLSTKIDDGDIYPHSDEEDQNKAKFRLTKQALMKLSSCAGIIWSVSESRRVDDGSNRDYVCYQAVGGLKKADGTPIFFKAQYDIDFQIIEAELRASYEQKAKKYKKEASTKEKAEYVEFCVNRDMLQKRKHKLKLAEAGAMNRVIREILGLKNAYTAAELQKPFAMVRIVFRPDYTDKDVKAKMIDAHIQAMTGVFGAKAISTEAATEPIDVTPITTKEDEETEKPSPEESAMIDFQNSDVPDQCRIITDRAKVVGYDLDGYMKKARAKDLKAFSPEQKAGLYKHLLSLPESAPINAPY
jgi:hypothetical protein